MSKSLVLALTVALGGIASAQPGPPPQPPPPMDTTTTTENPAPPEPNPQPQPPPPPPPAPTPVQAVEESDGTRPEGISIGLGVGYGLPTSLETPNLTSARLRLASGLTFEPLVTISNTSTTVDMGGTEAETRTTVFGISALVRLPMLSRGKFDLELLGTANFRTEKTNPPLDFDTRTQNNFGIGYGVGIAYWLSRHWNFSMSVTNPIVAYNNTKQQIGPGMSNKTSETTIGLIFVPAVFAMIHLYN